MKGDPLQILGENKLFQNSFGQIERIETKIKLNKPGPAQVGAISKAQK